jgi:signal transduction histidine kinase
VEQAIADIRQLSERVVRTQEDERQRIARDLHDGLGQRVTALQIVLQRAANAPASAPERLREAQALAAGILSEIRRVVRDLRPLELTSAGLASALAELCERFEMQTALATTFRHRGPDVNDEAISLCVWRIAQEALTNASRHANAAEVGVALVVQPSALELEIWDDGCGLPSDAAPSGTGLQSMRERATFLGGQFEVISAAGEGTKLRVTIPLHLTRSL